MFFYIKQDTGGCKIRQSKRPLVLLHLFGSRTSDEKRGGDIDLLVLSKKITSEDIRQIKYALWEELGEQKIDIVLAEDDAEPFVKIALEGGILL